VQATLVTTDRLLPLQVLRRPFLLLTTAFLVVRRRHSARVTKKEVEGTMVSITVGISAGIVRGGAEIEATGETIAQLLQSLKEQRYDISERLYDETGRHRRPFVIFVNGTNIRYLDGLETKLNDSDKVYIMPITSGG
jgi:MoaD family protein